MRLATTPNKLQPGLIDRALFQLFKIVHMKYHIQYTTPYSSPNISHTILPVLLVEYAVTSIQCITRIQRINSNHSVITSTGEIPELFPLPCSHGNTIFQVKPHTIIFKH